MTDLPDIDQKIQLEGTQFRSPVGENLVQTIGSSINYALDQIASIEATLTSLMHSQVFYNDTFTPIGPSVGGNFPVLAVPGTMVSFIWTTKNLSTTFPTNITVSGSSALYRPNDISSNGGAYGGFNQLFISGSELWVVPTAGPISFMTYTAQVFYTIP